MSEPRKEPPIVGETGRCVAANIRAIRKIRGMSQADLAEAIGRKAGYGGQTRISKIEALQQRLDVDSLADIAAALGIDPAMLLAPRLHIEVRPAQVQIRAAS